MVGKEWREWEVQLKGDKNHHRYGETLHQRENGRLEVKLEWEHTDLFGLTDAAKTFNSCGDSHTGFHTNLSTVYGACKTKCHFRFHVAPTNVYVSLHLSN